jgi:anti-sigma factor RsiW
MTDISCQTGVELLMDYLEGEIPEDLRKKLDAHVAGCEKCTAFVASYVATPRILRDVTRAAMPEELQRSLLDFLRAQRGEGPNQKN